MHNWSRKQVLSLF